MCRGYEIVNSDFVFMEEGVNVALVEDFGALRLREDEIEEETEPDPRVEGDPKTSIY